MSALMPSNEGRTMIAGDSREVLIWLLLTLVGWWMAWFIIYEVIRIATGDSLGSYMAHVMTVAGPIIGGVGAFLGQRRYLTVRLPGMGRWPVYSIFGWVMGFGLGNLIMQDIHGGLGWMICGCLLGLVQSFALRKKFRQPVWWVLISSIAWGTGGLLGVAFPRIFSERVTGDLTRFLHVGESHLAVLGFTTVILIAGLISGIGLMILFRKLSLAGPEQTPLKEP